MSDSNRKLIEENLADLHRLARKKQQPNRFHARELLTALGELILAEGEGLPEVELVRAAVTPFEHWEKAVAEELSLACTEHIQGVDPRYLDLPNYDFEYLVAARERLEARLTAVDALGLEVSEDLLNRVAEADRVVEPYLREQRGELGAN
ncbi:MAG: hypothetical protein KDC14_15650 [Planctomycetes bacterium]|nr:hypothetical protein [Planctomycetota bacterium]